MRIFLPIVSVVFGLSIADAEEPPQELQPAKEPQTLLPQPSQHSFVAVEPAWQKTVMVQRLEPESFVGVENPSTEEKKSLYKEIRYFAGSTHAANDAVKILTCYPNGSRYLEIDKFPDEQFTEHFFSDGRFADFTHWKGRKWIAGVAVDPRTGKANHFSEGTGSLTTYDDVHDSSRTHWYQNGDIFLEVRHSKSHLDKIRLNAGNDSLIVSKAEERLLLVSGNESWTRKAGEDPTVQIIGTPIDTDLPRMPQTGFSGPRGRLKELEMERQRVLRIWKAAYENRRASFVKHYAEILAATGQSLQSLGIEFISADPPWPER